MFTGGQQPSCAARESEGRGGEAHRKLDLRRSVVEPVRGLDSDMLRD